MDQAERAEQLLAADHLDQATLLAGHMSMADVELARQIKARYYAAWTIEQGTHLELLCVVDKYATLCQLQMAEWDQAIEHADDYALAG